jgi:hydrogenase nickel incorporation protein HypB
MCETCGCGDPEVVPVDVQESLLADNERRARHNREHLRARGCNAFNLMGSPGAGKTALLERTAAAWAGRHRVGAVSGDLATERDAERLRRAGIPSVSITTGQACHLDARLVHRALHELPPGGLDVLFIENVGNLVCPAIYDLGQERNVVLVSVTEGEDKPLKYPVMFRCADLVVVTKIDLLPALPDFRLDLLRENLARVMPEPAAVALSARSGEGLEGWLEWLEAAGGPLARDEQPPEHAVGG